MRVPNRLKSPSSRNTPITQREVDLYKSFLTDSSGPFKILIRLDEGLIVEPARTALSVTYFRKKDPKTGKMEKIPGFVELALFNTIPAAEAALFDVDRLLSYEDCEKIVSNFTPESGFFNITLALDMVDGTQIIFTPLRQLYCLHNSGRDKYFLTLELDEFVDVDPALYKEAQEEAVRKAKKLWQSQNSAKKQG